MLDAIGVESVDALIAETVPASIRMDGELDLEGAVPESEVLDRLRALARPQHGGHLLHRHRLVRHPPAAGHRTQRPGEPSLVHGLHPVPA